MKLTKYLLVACSALLFAACSHEDDWNTDSNVTVQFESATFKAKENSDLFYVPLEVSGKTNGPIRVTVDVAEVSENPAVANTHYIVTSKTVVIPNDSTEVSLEIAAVNDMDINDDRQFKITITNVEGAKVGQNNSVVVTITDDDSLFYEAIQGTWKFSGLEFWEPYPEDEYTVKITGAPEGDENYEKILYVSGVAGVANLTAEVEYYYDEESNTITIGFPLGQFVGVYGGTYDIYLFGVDGGYIDDSGIIFGTVNPTLRTITFDPDDVFFYGALQGNQVLGLSATTNVTMTR